MILFDTTTKPSNDYKLLQREFTEKCIRATYILVKRCSEPNDMALNLIFCV